ncbi:hypothetical protein [Azospirillum picis]|uniref:Lipoprotein n=1 Tax=Azospirillum picis TaxID=488438 RepID=A0ABU0MDD5_9PROT|nr:hypothetical protein [Azospirillum picis]MBP2297530.1 hypothetical protein [Azospirillum picis]MDQ0531447.1 hypothetical protein [Azospirillum picis]
MDRQHLLPVALHRTGVRMPSRHRRTVRAATPLALLAGLALALSACETVPPPPAAPPPTAALPDGPAKPFGTGKGWTVTIHTPPGAKPFCVAERAAAAGQPPGGETGAPRLAFRTATAESGFILSGYTPSDAGAAAKPGERYDLTASLDQGSRLTLSARALPDGTLYVAVPTARFLDEMGPLARGHRVAFRSSGLGDLGVLLLSGSSWAINASDECRILHADQ